MFLAINYSPAAARLYKAGKIHMDFFKTPDWDWMIAKARKLRPVAVHYTLEVGNGSQKGIKWKKLDKIAHDTHTPYINLHVDPKQKYSPDRDLYTNKWKDIKKVTDVLLADIHQVVERFGSQRVILENSPYRGEAGGTLRWAVEPELITQLIAETGCGLLLDISHAVVASHFIGMDPYEYLAGLPTDKIKEMHFAGIHRGKGGWMDHQSIRKKDWVILDWVLARIRAGAWSPPWLLAFEYGGVGPTFEWRTKPKVIAEQVPLLYDRIKQLSQQLP